MIAKILIFVVAAIFARLETNYFGNNLLPQSPMECVCDGLVFVMVCIGLAVPTKEKK